MTKRKLRILKAIVPAGLFAGLIAWLTIGDPFGSNVERYHPDEDNPDVTRSLDLKSGGPPPPVKFVDCALEAGIDFMHFKGGTRSSRLPEDMTGGAAWADIDNDGDDDLYVVDCAYNVSHSEERGSITARSGRGNRLYENLGDGTFRDITTHSRTGIAIIGLGAAWGDVDNDGYLDLVVTGYDSIHLFRNNQDGSFEDVTTRAGFDQDGFWSGAAFGDYDVDGDIDLYVCGYVDYDDSESDLVQEMTLQYRMAVPFALNPSSFTDSANRLYRNDGNIIFTEVATAAGVDGQLHGRLVGKSLGAVWIDLNEDGWPDLYVANDVSNNHLYLNNGDGTFGEAGATAWIADPRGAMGIAIGDFDNDSDVDLVITHWIAQENALYVNLARDMSSKYLGGEGLSFADRADILGLGQSSLDYVGWGANFFDFDNDGFLDLFVANGSTFEDSDDRAELVRMPSVLYRNLGLKDVMVKGEARRIPSGFVDCATFAGPFFEEDHVARGSTAADYDLDGDLDLIVCLLGERPRLLRNDSTTGNDWLKFRLRGTESNRFAVGAKLRIKTPDYTRLHCVGADPSYLCGSSTDTHVSLGAFTGSVMAEVDWPNGRKQSFVIDRSNCTVLIEEGRDEVVFLSGSGGPDTHGVPAPTGPLGARGSRLTGVAYQSFRKDFREATGLRVRGRYADAERHYREALRTDPLHADARFYLGSVLFDQGRFVEAVAAWERLLEIDPGSSKGKFMLGVAHACPLDGAPTDFAKAQSYFSQTFEANKEESGALLRLGELAIATGDLDIALRHLQEATDSYYSSVDGHFLLSYVFWKRGDRSRALEEIDHAVRFSKTDGSPRPSSGTDVLAEGDIADPSVLRLTNLYRVRPLAHRCIGLDARAPDPVDEAFCAAEFRLLDEEILQLR